MSTRRYMLPQPYYESSTDQKAAPKAQLQERDARTRHQRKPVSNQHCMPRLIRSENGGSYFVTYDGAWHELVT